MKKFIATAAVCAAVIFSEIAFIDSTKKPDICYAGTVSASAAVKKKAKKEKKMDILTKEEVDLVTKVVIAEAESEPEDGQRYVIDVILNRVDNKNFPDSVYCVLYQQHQFCVSGSRADAWKSVDSDIYDRIADMVIEEADKKNRADAEIVFFRTGKYSDYGVPAFKCGAHYFSTYD